MPRTIVPVAAGAGWPLAFLLMACVTAAPVAGQDATSRWWADAGVVHSLQSDELASPLRYRGFGAGIGLGWERVGSRTRGGFSVLYTRPALTSAISAADRFTEHGHRLHVTVPYLRRVHRMMALDLTAGARLSADAYYRRHDYDPFSEHYADGFVTLDAMGGIEYSSRAGIVIEERVAVTVAGIAWRGAYTGMKYAPDPRLELGNRLQAFSHALSAYLPLSRAIGVRVSHQLFALRHPEPWRLAVVTQGLHLGLEWRRAAAPASDARSLESNR